jgi:hypothetical protein
MRNFFLSEIGFLVRVLMIHYVIKTLYKVKGCCYNSVIFDDISHVSVFEKYNLSGFAFRKMKHSLFFLGISGNPIIVDYVKMSGLSQRTGSVIYSPLEPWVPAIKD